MYMLKKLCYKRKKNAVRFYLWNDEIDGITLIK